MTLARTRRDFLGFIWQSFSIAGRFFRSAHLRVMARRQARLLAQQPMVQQPTITVAAQPIVPQIAEPAILSPTEVETLQVSEQVSYEMTGQAGLSYKTQDTQDAQDTVTTSSPSQPELTRGQMIEALLDEAWGRGIMTYPQLIAYVTEQTGTGCSRRSIAAWKKQRGL